MWVRRVIEQEVEDATITPTSAPSGRLGRGELSQNDATGDGGTCYGDSGCPCLATNVTYRLDGIGPPVPGNLRRPALVRVR